MKLYRFIFVSFLIACSASSVAEPQIEREREIHRSEEQLKWLEHNSTVHEFYSSIINICIDGPPALVAALSVYQNAIIEEQRLVAAGMGENHPKLKAIREQKRLGTEKIADWIALTRSHLAAKLTELRKEPNTQ